MDEITINNWKEFEGIFIDSKRNKPNSHSMHSCYRGQSDTSWKIESSLYRIIKDLDISEEKSKKIENSIIREFKANAHLYDEFANSKFNNNEGLFSIMQHYSCPTRLVDWSMSPYIGLYFSVNDNFSKDGCIFILNNHQYERNLELKYKELELVNPTELQSIVANHHNMRLNLQQGAFTSSDTIMSSHCQLIENLGIEVNQSSGLSKYIIPKQLKIEFLSNLKLMNIDSKTLFPDLDGFGRSLKEKLLVRNWIEQIK